MSEPAKPKTLAEYLLTKPVADFKPLPTYSIEGDMLVVYLENEPAYSEPINAQVTVERAFSDRRIVGVKIFGVSDLVQRTIEAAIEQNANSQTKTQ